MSERFLGSIRNMFWFLFALIAFFAGGACLFWGITHVVPKEYCEIPFLIAPLAFLWMILGVMFAFKSCDWSAVFIADPLAEQSRFVGITGIIASCFLGLAAFLYFNWWNALIWSAFLMLVISVKLFLTKDKIATQPDQI